MAIGKASDMKVYNEFIHSGMVETLVQVSAAFNAASGGCITLRADQKRGDYEYESFFKAISGLVTRRDTTSTGAATDLAVSQGEIIRVKLNRKIGPAANTLDSLRKIARNATTEGALDFALGVQVAKAMQVEMCDTALAALVAALAAQATNAIANTAANITTANLVSMLAKMGDAASRVKLWVMHSKPYYDLVQSQITANIDGVSNFNIASATPITLNRPVLVTDSPSLLVAGAPDTYKTLGLVEGAGLVENTEEEIVVREFVTGLENLVVRYQGEFAYNLGLKGFQWDVANGGANPLAAAIGTGSNWDKVATSYKDLGGVLITTQ